MQRMKNFMSKVTIARELLGFMWERRLWWLIPMVTLLLMFGLLIVATQGTAVAPFIYALF